MGGAGMTVGKKLLIWVISGLIVKTIFAGAKNVLDGKDILGRKITDPPKKTYVDWKGDVRLCRKDYQIV